MRRCRTDCGQWDTANVYSNGESERVVGNALKKLNIPRSKVVILSKCLGTVAEQVGLPAITYKPQITLSKTYVNQYG